MCFEDLEKVFDKAPRNVVEWAMGKKGILDALVIAVIELYKGAWINVKVGTYFL